MPYVNKPRPYKHEYEMYDGTPAVKKKRAERNKARRMLEKAGVVHKGDGKDSNLTVKSASANRSYSRNSDHTVKRNKPKNGNSR
jgi:hypothetical protein